MKEHEKIIKDLVNDNQKLKSDIDELKRKINQNDKKVIKNTDSPKILYECSPNKNQMNGIFNYLKRILISEMKLVSNIQIALMIHTNSLIMII